MKVRVFERECVKVSVNDKDHGKMLTTIRQNMLTRERQMNINKKKVQKALSSPFVCLCLRLFVFVFVYSV